MQPSCSYCDQLKKADKSNNFCSKAGHQIHSLKSNAFYFKSKQLYSGQHISRLTFRSISNGYQYHCIEKKEIMLDAGKYLITNAGQHYESEIDTHQPIEGLVIAFSHNVAKRSAYYLNASHEQLLDNPFRSAEIAGFFPTIFNQTDAIQSILLRFKEKILAPAKYLTYDDEDYYQLMLLLIKEKQTLQSKVDLINAKKSSTRNEIFKRLSIGKEYIDLHLEDTINLEKLSRICTMSPFHLLRSFKAFYKQTPHQYLNAKRLEKAQFLLKDTLLPIEQIAEKVGFEHVRSFRRLFKQSFRLSPAAFRRK